MATGHPVRIGTVSCRRGYRLATGFSLMELSVCLGIVSLLLIVSIPAVLAARENSRMQQCRDNMRQIGLALHNYHDVFAVFPPAWVSRDVKAATSSGLGWQVSILSYMDRQNLFNRIHPNGHEFHSYESQLLQEMVSAYLCPSDVTPRLNPFRDEWGTSNYTANAGHLSFPRWVASPNRQFWPGQLPVDPGLRQTGLMYRNSSVRIRDCADGTSNTFLTGERSVLSGAGIWAGVRSNLLGNDVMTNGSHPCRPNASFGSYSSQHLAVNMLMCDGSVKSLDPQIDSLPQADKAEPWGVFQRLSARDDRQVIPQHLVPR